MREVQTEIRTMREIQEAHDKKAQRAFAVILEVSVEFADVGVEDAESLHSRLV